MKVILYTAKYCPYSLRARIALSEKKMMMEVLESNDLSPEILKKVSPYGVFPVLQEKDYRTDNKKALLLYIDERFPAPGLLPSIVNDRIKIRFYLEKIDTEWYPVLQEIKIIKSAKASKTRDAKLKDVFSDFKDSLISMEGVFADDDFFMCSNFTLADCYISALLIALEVEGFKIDESFGSIFEYKKRVFARDSVKKASLNGNSGDSLLKTIRMHR